MKDAVKARLRAGEAIAVCDPDFPTPRMVEFIGAIGFDAIFIDCEHSSSDFRLVEELARAARAAGMDSILRPWSNEEGLLNRYLSCGVGGLQLPHVRNAAEARHLLEGLQRWGDGDFGEKLLVVMIESAEALQALPELLKIGEIDAFYFGTNDLAESMGLRGKARHPTVKTAVAAGIRQIAAAGRAAGINVQNDLGSVAEYRRLGARWITVHQKVFIQQGAEAFLGSVRNHS